MAQGHELPPGKFFETNMRGDAKRWEMEMVHFETQSCHIVSLDRENLLHVYFPRRVWMIFPI